MAEPLAGRIKQVKAKRLTTAPTPSLVPMQYCHGMYVLVISGNISSAAERVVWSGNKTTQTTASTIRCVTLEIYNIGNLEKKCNFGNDRV